MFDLPDEMRTETEQRNYLVTTRAYELAADPTKTYVPPEEQSAVPYINFAPLQNALTHLEQSAKDYDDAVKERITSGEVLTRDMAESLNRILISTERMMTYEEGLPRRPWFKHQIYAPGFYTGYGVKTLPGIREGIEQRTWEVVEKYVEIVAAALNRVAGAIDRAAEVVREEATDGS